MPDPRTETVRFRCSPSEVADFERAASADHRSVSDWLRVVAMRASENVGPVVPVIQTTQIRSARDLEEAIGLPAKRTPEVAKAVPAPRKAPKPTEAEVASHPSNDRPTFFKGTK